MSVSILTIISLAAVYPFSAHVSASSPTLPLIKYFVPAPPTGKTGPDDIALLSTPGLNRGNPVVWTAYQNGINPDGTAGSPGGPTQSTIAGYDLSSGALVKTIQATGKSDGLTADQVTGKLVSTLNEDSHSSMALVDPVTGSVTYYTYSPDPAVSGNGGTDSIAVINGNLYLAHSNPNDLSQAAVYQATLNDATHTASLTPVYYCNSMATSINTGKAVMLGIADPDTNFAMPQNTPSFPGALAQIGQADGQIIFSTPSLTGTTQLQVLNLTDNKPGNVPPTDGLAVATSDRGTLYVVDASGNNIQAFDTTGWPVGTVFIGEPKDAGNPLVGTLNLKTGVITPFSNPFVSPKGLLFVPASRNLPLVKVLVSAPPLGTKGPDDITPLSVPSLDSGRLMVWTAYQNGILPNGTAGSTGGPTQSTLAGYDASTGALLTTIQVMGKSDGLTANQAAGKLISTLNEDSHSSIAVIDPSSGSVTYYTYSPDPAVSGNGGTDSIAIINGNTYLAHSNPNDLSQAAVYQVTFNDATHTATLTSAFNCNSMATNINTGATVTLGLADPDTNFAMPQGSSYAGALAQIGQADGQIVFMTPSSTGSPNLRVLNVTDNKLGNTPPLDGFAVATSDHGTLFVVDAKSNTIQAFDTTGLPAGTVFVGEPNDVGNPLVGTLNLQTGVVTPFSNTFASPKGLLFVEAPFASPLQGTTTTTTVVSTNVITQTSVSTQTLVSTYPSAPSTETTTVAASSSGLDYALYGAIALLVVVAIALGFLASRRGK